MSTVPGVPLADGTADLMGQGALIWMPDIDARAREGNPARVATEWQWTLGQMVAAVVAVGMELLSLGEYPEPFWRLGGASAAAWDGRLPNSFSLLAAAG